MDFSREITLRKKDSTIFIFNADTGDSESLIIWAYGLSSRTFFSANKKTPTTALAAAAAAAATTRKKVVRLCVLVWVYNLISWCTQCGPNEANERRTNIFHPRLSPFCRLSFTPHTKKGWVIGGEWSWFESSRDLWKHFRLYAFTAIQYRCACTKYSTLLYLPFSVSLSRFRSFDRSFSPCLSFSFSKQCSKFLIEVSHELRWLPINYKMQKLFCDSMTVSMVLLTVRVYCVTCNVCVLHITTDFLARLFSCKTKERVAWPLIGNEICYSSSSSNNANKKAARLHLQKSNISTWK